MPQRAPAPTPGAVCWVDLLSSDPPAAVAFYAALFSWGADVPADEPGGYVTFESGGVPVAGLAPNIRESGIPDAWTVYLACADLAGAEAAVDGAGGVLTVQGLRAGSTATLSIATDPGGAAVGLWDARRHNGFGAAAGRGGPGADRRSRAVWFELVTRDYDGVLAFYRDIAGWSYRPLDAGPVRYSFCDLGGTTVAGVLDGGAGLEPGVASHWQVFFGVPDLDSALGRVVELGGAVLQPAWDTGFGRRAMVADPTGARFLVASVPDG